MWGYTMFPTGGFSTKPVYISRIEDKNGNVLARQEFDTQRKEVLSQSTAYIMSRMMQGPVDIGTAAGLRARLGVAEMGGKTGTTNDYSDSWFLGFTPQLQAGVWIGCDDPFLRLDGKLGEGGQAARPIYEYFFQKALADKTLGLDKQAKFIQPENMKMEYDFQLINREPASSENDIGNGNADEYLSTPDTGNVPVESKLSLEETKVLDAAKKKNQDPENTDNKDANNPQGKDEKKKKDGFFKRIFGKKKDKEQNN
jgi:penicillin-binding protein 1A